jgi:hypothetical protein
VYLYSWLLLENISGGIVGFLSCFWTEKAFDSIDRPILFHYLVEIGLPILFIKLLIKMYEITLSLVFIVKKRCI